MAHHAVTQPHEPRQHGGNEQPDVEDHLPVERISPRQQAIQRRRFEHTFVAALALDLWRGGRHRRLVNGCHKFPFHECRSNRTFFRLLTVNLGATCRAGTSRCSRCPFRPVVWVTPPGCSIRWRFRWPALCWLAWRLLPCEIAWALPGFRLARPGTARQSPGFVR